MATRLTGRDRATPYRKLIESNRELLYLLAVSLEEVLEDSKKYEAAANIRQKLWEIGYPELFTEDE